MSAGVLRVDVCTCFEKHVNHRRIGLSGVHGLHENSTAVFIRRVHISSGFRQFENSFDIAIVDNILQHIRDVLFVNLAGVGPGFRQRDKSCEVGPVRRDVQRRLPLRADSVDLRSSVNEDVDDLSRGVLIARGGHQNRSALLVLDLRVGPGAEKHFEDIRVCVVPRGCHQRRQALLLRRRIHIGPCLYQQYGNLRIFTHRGSHHGGNVVLAPGVDVRPSSEQRGDDLGVLVRSCGHERRLAVLAHGVHVRPGVHQELDGLWRIVCRSDYQRRLLLLVPGVDVRAVLQRGRDLLRFALPAELQKVRVAHSPESRNRQQNNQQSA